MNKRSMFGDTKLSFLIEFPSVKSHRVHDMGLHNNLIWLSFLSIGSPKHKVLEVGLLKG